MNSQEFCIKIKEYLDFVDDFLDGQKTFPIKTEALICMVQKEFEFKDSEKRKVDMVVRMYLSDHDKYKISVGVAGGIKPKQSNLDKVIPNEIKAELEAEIERRVNERIKKSKEASDNVTSSFLEADEKF